MPHPTAALPLLRSFRVQIALLFGGLTILLCGALAIALGTMLSDEVRQDRARSLDVMAQVAASTLADGMAHRLNETRSLAGAADLWVHGLSSPGAASALARSQALTPHSAWIGVADPQGIIRMATGDLLLGQSVAARPWFAQGLSGSHVGDVHAAKLLASLLPADASGEPLRFVDFAAPIKVDGQVIGVLGVHGTWDWARDVLESLLPESAARRSLAFFIFDKDGHALYAPTASTTGGAGLRETLPLLTAARGRPASFGIATWSDGLAYLTSTARVVGREPRADLGWTVAVREPVALAFADARASSRKALAVGLVVALLAGALAWVASGFLSRPLASVARAAQEVEQGVPGARIPQLGHSRELQGLSQALAGMTSRLLSAKDALEERVRQRTAELHQANEELERANGELHALARHDSLTGLPNRRAFEEHFDRALSLSRRTGAPLSVLSVDADHFKAVNDRFGHDVGDLVLKAIARTLSARLRETDLVARIGGEEFVVVLPATDGAGALLLAESLVAMMAAQALPVAGRVTVSIGVATAAGDAEPRADLLRRADRALYRAKAEGRNRACGDGMKSERELRDTASLPV